MVDAEVQCAAASRAACLPVGQSGGSRREHHADGDDLTNGSSRNPIAEAQEQRAESVVEADDADATSLAPAVDELSALGDRAREWLLQVQIFRAPNTSVATRACKCVGTATITASISSRATSSR